MHEVYNIVTSCCLSHSGLHQHKQLKHLHVAPFFYAVGEKASRTGALRALLCALIKGGGNASNYLDDTLQKNLSYFTITV